MTVLFQDKIVYSYSLSSVWEVATNVLSLELDNMERDNIMEKETECRLTRALKKLSSQTREFLLQTLANSRHRLSWILVTDNQGTSLRACL